MYDILDFKKVSNATSQKTFDVENSTPFYSPYHILHTGVNSTGERAHIDGVGKQI
jgi:hypothetical protein